MINFFNNGGKKLLLRKNGGVYLFEQNNQEFPLYKEGVHGIYLMDELFVYLVTLVYLIEIKFPQPNN